MCVFTTSKFIFKKKIMFHRIKISSIYWAGYDTFAFSGIFLVEPNSLTSPSQKSLRPCPYRGAAEQTRFSHCQDLFFFFFFCSVVSAEEALTYTLTYMTWIGGEEPLLLNGSFISLAWCKLYEPQWSTTMTSLIPFLPCIHLKGLLYKYRTCR